LGLINGVTPIVLDPVFNSNVPNGYQALLPEVVDKVTLEPLTTPAGTETVVEVNGVEVPAEDMPDLPLEPGVNRVVVSVYDDAPLAEDGSPRKLLGQYEIVIYNGTLSIESITVYDETPNQATLEFSRVLDADLTVEDFAGLTIDGKQVVEVLGITGSTVKVQVNAPFAPLPDGKLASAYVQTPEEGGITTFNGAVELMVP